MNTGGFVDTPISQDQVLVWVALTLAAVLAVLVIGGMVWGARLKRQRAAAEEAEEKRNAALEAEGVQATSSDPESPEAVAATHDEAPSPAPVPTTPSPPPLGDQPVPGTPARQAPLADEPIAAAAPLDASPATVADPTPAHAPAAAEGGGALTQLKGLGPRIAARLGELGVADVEALAALDDAAAARLDEQMGSFKGRMARDRWREQARLLAAGDRAGFEREFGRLG